MAWDDLYSLPDPEEERRQREAALAALAAGGGADGAAMAPDLEPPAQLEIPMSRADRVVELPEQTITADMAPETAPDPSLEDGSERFDWRAALAAEGNGAYQAAQSGTAPAEPRPGRGPSDALRSPTANELPSKDGQPAPASGQVKDEVPPEQDPFEALARKGEQLQERRLKEMGDEPSVNGWAILADAVFNRGKSIPSMLQMVDNDKRAWREGRSRILAQGARSAYGGDPFAKRRLDLQERGLKAEEDRLKASTDKSAATAQQFEADRNAIIAGYGDALTDEEREKLSGASPSALRTLKGVLDKKYGFTHRDEAKAVKEAQSSGTTAGRIKTEHELRELKGETAGTVAGAVAQAQGEAGAEKPETPRERAAREKSERDEAYKRERDKKDDDWRAEQRRLAQENKDTAWQTTFSDKNRPLLDMAGELNWMQDRIAENDKNKKPTRGLGHENSYGENVDSVVTSKWVRGLVPEMAENAEAEADFRGKRERLGKALIHGESGMAFSMSEEERNKIEIGSNPSASEAQARIAIQTMNDVVDRAIGGKAAANPELVKSIFESAGLDHRRWHSDRWGGGRRRGAAPMASPDPTLSEGQTAVINEDGDEVVEGAYADPRDATPSLGTASLPKQPSFGGEKREYTVTLPNGKSAKRPLSEREVEMYRRKGIRVE
jgi:hypothetical protein